VIEMFAGLRGSATGGKPGLDTLPEVLTTREGAQVLRCSKAHFCNLLNGKVAGVPRLPYLRLGRRQLVRKASLVRWLEQVEARAVQR
jgi:hypothetical protein